MVRILAMAFLAFFFLPAQAQTVTGTITDGLTTWYLTKQNGAGQSSWSSDNNNAIVTMFGQASKITTEQTQGALSIRFYLFEPENAQQVSEVDIVYYKEVAKGAYVTRGHGSGSIIKLDSVRQSGGTLTISGTFKADLYFTDDFGATLDETDMLPISGRFSAMLKQD